MKDAWVYWGYGLSIIITIRSFSLEGFWMWFMLFLGLGLLALSSKRWADLESEG